MSLDDIGEVFKLQEASDYARKLFYQNCGLRSVNGTMKKSIMVCLYSCGSLFVSFFLCFFFLFFFFTLCFLICLWFCSCWQLLLQSDDDETKLILSSSKKKLRNCLNTLQARHEVPFDAGKIVKSKFKRLILPVFNETKEDTEDTEDTEERDTDIIIDENEQMISCANLHYSDLVKRMGRKAVRKSISKRRQMRIISARWAYRFASQNWRWIVSSGLFQKQIDGSWRLVASTVSS